MRHSVCAMVQLCTMLLLLIFPIITEARLGGAPPAPSLCPDYPLPVPIEEDDLRDAFQQVDEFITTALNTVNVPGFFISIVYNDSILWSNGYGSRNFSDPTAGPPTIDSGLRVASITKTFTTLMLFMLRDQGVIQLDDPVTKYLPQFAVQNPFATRRSITLHQLATHTSGLQRETPECDNCTEAEILSAVAQTYLLSPPYSRAHYSNLGIALLGRALEKAVISSYENWTTAQILEPLQMNSSGFFLTQQVAQNLAVAARVLANGTLVPSPVGPPGWDCPCGGLYSTARDMSNYISAIFRNDLAAGDIPSQIVDGSTVEEWTKAFYVLPDGKNVFGTPWELFYTQKYWVRSKAGAVGGYRSQVATIPELKLGVFTSALSEDIDNAPSDTNQSVLTIPIMNIVAPALEQLLWSRQPQPPKPIGISLIGGKYIGDGLILSIDEQDDRIYAVSDSSDVFVLTQFLNLSTQLLYRVRFQNSSSIDCRWLNDGPDNEYMYFYLPNSSSHAQSLQFMGVTAKLHISSSQ